MVGWRKVVFGFHCKYTVKIGSAKLFVDDRIFSVVKTVTEYIRSNADRYFDDKGKPSQKIITNILTQLPNKDIIKYIPTP